MTAKPPLVMDRSGPHAQRGIALLTALFIVALATIAAVALVSSSSIALRRTENLIDSERAWWYADGAESWVKSILVEDTKSKKGNPPPDSLGDAWAQPIDFLPIDQGGIRGRVIDLQGLFNLNNLGVTNQAQLANVTQQFQRLLENIKGIDSFTAAGLGEAIHDWIDADDDRIGANGAEDGDYLSLDPPYRAANQPFRSVSELMAVRGMTADLYTKLLPNICAIPLAGKATAPTPTPININTAPLPVLMSLSATLDAQKVQAFTEDRIKNPATDTTIIQNWGQTSGAVAPKDVTVSSQYFELQAEVVVGSARVALYSVFLRPPGSGGTNGPPVVPVVIAHSTDTE